MVLDALIMDPGVEMMDCAVALRFPLEVKLLKKQKLERRQLVCLFTSCGWSESMAYFILIYKEKK